MNNKKLYTLPELPYGYSALEPWISEEQLKIHHQKHHQAYINSANAINDKLWEKREKKEEIDVKSILKELSFHIGGYVLHSKFWFNMRPAIKDNKPKEEILKKIEDDFGSFERFKEEFSKAAVSVEGSGWAALAYCKRHDGLLISQIEKHNVNVYPDFKILMVLDVWEHAYYLDYKNERARFVEGFWDVVNWDEVNSRLLKTL